MSVEDENDVPYGSGCGGTIDLLFEPVESPECQALLTAMQGSLEGRRFDVITFLPTDDMPLARAILSAEGEVVYRSEGLAQVQVEAAQNGIVPHAFVESLVPPQRLVIVGAGDDAKPLMQFASSIGWNVTVMDGRSQLARSERFPSAQRVEVIRAEKIDEAGITQDDAVVLMSS